MSEIRSGTEEVRDTRGRFTPGTSGNPHGRPPGITDKRVQARKQWLDPLIPEAVEKLAEAVSEGERWAIETVLAYSFPKPKPVDPEELEEFETRLVELEEMTRQ